MSDGRQISYDPDAGSSDPNLPGFLARPAGAPVYHGFTVVPESMTDGWVYGAITAYDCEEPQTEGDGFVIAPDGSRAGIAWATDTPEFYEILPPDDNRWGVYGVCFARPVSCVEDLVSNFRLVLPKLKDQLARLHKCGT
jgi:hypothetical protein